MNMNRNTNLHTTQNENQWSKLYVFQSHLYIICQMQHFQLIIHFDYCPQWSRCICLQSPTHTKKKRIKNLKRTDFTLEIHFFNLWFYCEYLWFVGDSTSQCRIKWAADAVLIAANAVCCFVYFPSQVLSLSLNEHSRNRF